jgi:flavorubredoxin
MPGGFTFNQFLIVDDAPLLFHTGPRKLFPMTRTAINRVLPDLTTHTLFCGDLFTQFGAEHSPLTTDDILETSDAARRALDYYAHSPDTTTILARLAATQPTTLACMHGASWQGNGAALLDALGRRLGETTVNG